MDKELIIALQAAIEELAIEIRSMRGADSGAVSGVDISKRSTICSGEDSLELKALDRDPEQILVPEIHAPTNIDLADLIRIRKDVLEAREEYDQVHRDLEEKDFKLADARQELQNLGQSVESMEARSRDLEIRLEALNELEVKSLKLQQELAEGDQRLQTIRTEENEFDARKGALLAREEELQVSMERTKHASELLRKLWPVWLCSEDLRHWKEVIEKDVFLENSPPSFALLFAAIHNYSASQRDPDSRILLDSLRDLGRRLYQWLKDLGEREESMAVIAEAWATAINAECGERCSVQIAVPGNPADAKWMNFTPKTGSSPDVTNVRSWCVSDNQGRPIHRAEIAV